jgi:hypothetical protein
MQTSSRREDNRSALLESLPPVSTLCGGGGDCMCIHSSWGTHCIVLWIRLGSVPYEKGEGKPPPYARVPAATLSKPL